MANFEPPIDSPLVKRRNWKKNPDPEKSDPQEGIVEEIWSNYFVQSGQTTQSSPTNVVAPVSLTDQTGSIGTTPIAGQLPGGLYRFTFTSRITVPAGATSSLLVTLLWTDGGVSQTLSSVPITANTTTTHDSQTYLIHTDNQTLVSYSTTYASSGVPAMQYYLAVVLEQINA